MKLYDVPRNTKVRLVRPEEEKEDAGHAYVPPAHRELNWGDVLMFRSIDGMYSFCHDKNGNIVHPAAWTEVEIVSEGCG